MIKLDTSTKQMIYNSFQTLTLDKIELSEYLYKQSHNDRLHNLVLAQTSCEGNNLEYIWDHINNQSEIYLPILVCPDDVDFWCMVLVAKIKYTQDTVIWERLAFVE